VPGNSAGSRKPPPARLLQFGQNLVQQLRGSRPARLHWTNGRQAGGPDWSILFPAVTEMPLMANTRLFDNLFPTNHRQFGMMDIFSWENVQILRASWSVQPLNRSSVAADYRLVLGFADTHDSFYTNKGRGGAASDRPMDGLRNNPNSSSYVGSEIDLVATYAIPALRVVAGRLDIFLWRYVISSLAGIGGAKDATFAYLQVTINF